MVDIHPEHARAVLGELAIGVVLIDREARVTWLNSYAAMLLGTDVHELLGRKIASLRVPYSTPNAEDTSQVCVKGTLIGITQRCSHPAGDGAMVMMLDRGHALVGSLNALSRGIPGTMSDSGILPRSATVQRLEAEISRSRRYSNPLSCITITAADLRQLTMSTAALMINGQLRWVDLLGQWSDEVLLLVLPETAAAAARKLATKLSLTFAGASHDELGAFAIGWASWRRGDGPKELVERACVVGCGEAVN
jgi:hypothetical protein